MLKDMIGRIKVIGVEMVVVSCFARLRNLGDTKQQRRSFSGIEGAYRLGTWNVRRETYN